MNRRRILLLLALVAMAAGLVLFWPRGPKEPVYQGKGITFWINEVPATGLPEALAAARKAVRATSPDSRRFLMSEFTRRDPKWLASFRVWLDNRFGRDAYTVAKVQRMETASYGLWLLGPEITPALPTLAEYLEDEERGRIAAMAMSGAGDAAIPYLMRAIASMNPLVEANAGEGIVALARESESMLPTFFQWLQHTNAMRRSIAVRALGTANSQTNSIVPALTAALSDPDSLVQWQAALLLGNKGPASKPAIPALLRLMTNSNPRTAAIASNVVLQIDPTALPPRGP